MGGGASAARPLQALSADGVKELAAGIGPSYSDLAKQLHELGHDGEDLAEASSDDLIEIFDELEVPKFKQKLLRRKLDKLKGATLSTGGRPTAAAARPARRSSRRPFGRSPRESSCSSLSRLARAASPSSSGARGTNRRRSAARRGLVESPRNGRSSLALARRCRTTWFGS